MAQTIRPNSDISRSGWTLTGAASAWDCINDDPDSSDADSTYIVTSTVGSTVEVALTNPTTPAVFSDHQIKYRARGTVSGFGLKTMLVQGAGLSAVILATRIFSLRAIYQSDTFDVPIAAAGSITDYTDLRLRFELVGTPGSGECRITAAEVTIPDASLTAVDARAISRISASVLSAVVPLVATRAIAGVLMDATTYLRASRIVAAVLGPAPISPAVTRATVGVLSDNPSGASVRATRTSAAVLSSNPLSSTRRTSRLAGAALSANPMTAFARVSRGVAAVLSDNPSNDFRRVSRVTAAALVTRTGTEMTTPAPLPSTLPSILIANWARPIGLETSWQTDVQSTPSTGAEERYSLASRPKRTFDFVTTAVHARQLGDALLSAARHGQDRVPVPVHVDKVRLTSWNGTTWLGDFSCRRFSVGARVFVWRVGDGGSTSDVQLGQIATMSAGQIVVIGASLSSSDPGPFRVTPAADVEINLSVAAGLASAEAGEVQYQLDEVSGSSSIPASSNGLPAGFAVYQGAPILDLDAAIDASQRVQIGLIRDGSSRGMGRDQVASASGPRPRWSVVMPMLFARRADWWSALQFFDSRRGRALPFWSIVPGAPFGFVSNSGTSLTISAAGNVVNALDFVSGIAIVMRGGVRHVRLVEDIEESGENWLVTLQESIATLDPAQVIRVSVAFLSRFNRDGIEERWLGDGDSVRTSFEVVELLAEDDVEIETSQPAAVSGAPDAIEDLFAWFDAGSHVYSWQSGSNWVPSSPYPSPDIALDQPAWLVQRWVDARNHGIAEPLETPRLDSASGSTSAGGMGQVSGFDKQRVSVETCKTIGGGLTRFRPRLGDGNPWSNTTGKGFTAIFVGAQPSAVFLDLRNNAGLPLVYWDVGSLQLFSTPGFTDPSRAAIYSLTAPAAPGIPMTLVGRWAPGAAVQVVQGGVVLATASATLSAMSNQLYVPDQSEVLRGVTAAAAANPMSIPLKLAGVGSASRSLALLLYSRRLSDSELNSLGAYFRDRYGSPWVNL